MNWLEHVTTERVVPTLKRYDSSIKAKLEYTSADHIESRYNGFTYEYAHKTKLCVQTIWYANDAQFSGRQKVAERAIVEMVFEPYTKIRHRLLHSLMDKDIETVLELLGRMEKEMGLE